MRKFKEFLKNRMQEARQNQKGFSLVELIIVIAILGIIAAIALPNVTKSLDNSKKQADITNAKAIANAIAILEAEGTGNSGVTRGAASIELPEKVVAELNGTTPTPKLVSDGKFVVKIDDGTSDTVAGAITVSVSYKDANDANATPQVIEVYPVAKGLWQ